MNHVYAKIKHRGKSNKYRKVLSTNENIYHPADELIESSCPYTPGTMLETGAWFKISEFSKQKYSIEITHDDYETVDYDSLHESEYLQVDYLFAEIGGNLFFQNISKSKLVKKKGILGIGEKYQYENEIEVLFINEYPDAIYIPTEDALYFQRLESVSGIFKGMEELYREATTAEVAEFLNSEFITLTYDFNADKVKTLNRKRIALAKDILNKLQPSEKTQIFSYIEDYCPELSAEDQKFRIGTDDDLKMLLYGIDQRFYTTPVGNEQRVANSMYPLKNHGGSHGQP